MEGDNCEGGSVKGNVGEPVRAGEAGRRKSWGADCCRAWCGAVVVVDIKSLLWLIKVDSGDAGENDCCCFPDKNIDDDNDDGEPVLSILNGVGIIKG